METINKRFDGYVLLATVLPAIALLLVIVGCAARKYTYKVVFENGDYEYYELNYKPHPDCRAIEYDGETIIGVQKIERVE